MHSPWTHRCSSWQWCWFLQHNWQVAVVTVETHSPTAAGLCSAGGYYGVSPLPRVTSEIEQAQTWFEEEVELTNEIKADQLSNQVPLTGIYTQVWGCAVEMSDSSVSSIFRSIKSTVKLGVLPWRWADVSPSGCTGTAANHHPGPSHLESLSCSNLK